MNVGPRPGLRVLLPVIALTALVTAVVTVHLIGGSDDGESARATSIASIVLAERRQYSVQLPASYARSPQRRYPVIYVLDAPSQDAHTAASAALMARIGVTPEAIVVGVHNLDGESRQRDFTPPGMRQNADGDDDRTGRADRFHAFIRDELLPEIDQRYRTSSFRILAGWSRAGLFVVYSLTQDPGLFRAYVANSPAVWRDDAEMVKRLDRFLRSGSPTKTSLFLSLGSAENAKMKRGFLRAVALLRANAPTTLRWHQQLTPGAKHEDNPELATPIALRWAFDPRWDPASAAPDRPHDAEN
jgi:hypothetical protein